MYTFGYLREATQAHLDLDEQEIQAMHLTERYHIFANEAMQAICAVKPKYDYFKCKTVAKYKPIINLGNNQFREATLDEINWESHTSVKPNFADETDTKLWYEGQDIYLLNHQVRMPEEFIAFAEKQAWAFIHNKQFDSEIFVKGHRPTTPPNVRVRVNTEHFQYTGRNTITFTTEGEFWIPYKAIWFRFKSGISDSQDIDMPVDIFLTIPLYIAAQCLQIDHVQRAQAKRAEFEAALARCSATDFMELRQISPTYR